MNEQFENMQKLAFGKVLISESIINEKFTKDTLKAQIREIILDEAKKKKSKKEPEDVAPQEDIDINMDNEQPTGEEVPTDTIAPEATTDDIDPTVKSIQDSLQKAFVQAKQLGDEKLATQIGNTLTMLLRDQVLGQQ